MEIKCFLSELESHFTIIIISSFTTMINAFHVYDELRFIII